MRSPKTFHAFLPTRRLAGVALVAACVSLPAWRELVSRTSIASTAREQDLDSEAGEREAIAKQVFRDNCLMCHGEELTTGQRLTAKQWTAEVDKMVGWGAPVPADQKRLLIDYLAGQYSDRTPAARLERSTLAEASRGLRAEPGPEASKTGDSSLGAKLYAANCATCHGADGRGGDLGTNLVGRPVLYQPEEFQKLVRQGLRRMPGFAAALKAEQVAHILTWCRDQRYPAAPR